MPSYQAVAVDERPPVHRVTMDRPERENSIDSTLLAELNAVLDRAESTPDCRIVLLEGSSGVFCAGMDFGAAVRRPPDRPDAQGPAQGGAEFYRLLRRFTETPRLVVSWVDGRATGGGVGLAAASDFVLASERSQFGLPEALWGLLPCSVLPFLIRRVGFQKAYTMTLSTQPVPAVQAERYHLVDELAAEPDPAVRRLAFRATKLQDTTIADAKRYFQQLWFIGEETEQVAVAEFARLMATPQVRQNIRDFVTRQRFPWEA